MSPKPIKKNWPRYLLQWGSLAAIVFFLSGLYQLIFPKAQPANPEALCPMGGLQALATYGVRGSLPCSMSSLQIFLGLALAAAVVLFSKLFCGYLCPIGTVEDLLIKLRKKLKIKAIVIKQKSVLDKILRVVKYVLVFWVFYMTATASELFCKNFDPYYAVATGFKGEITLWMSIVSVTLLLLGSFLVDMFWCKYLCPLGAISNSLKFWAWMLGISALWLVLNKLGLQVSWVLLLGVLCAAGYLLEILCSEPKLQLLHVIRDSEKCTGCGLCNKACPYHIDVAGSKGKVTCVDCTLCGECLGACRQDALAVGVGKKAKGPAWKYVPAVLTLLLLGIGIWVGSRSELPTIDEQWKMEEVDASTLKSFEMQPLRSVKCFGSSMAFKGKLEQIPGTHGVRTYVGKHRVVITYDPAVTTEDKIKEAIFVPTKFRVENPDLAAVEQVKMVTIRTEDMPDRMDLNNLGLQMRFSDKKIYGVESQFDCPLIVRVYMDPSEQADAKWFRDIVQKKSVDMPMADGTVKTTPVSFRFVQLEEGETLIPVADYMRHMFTPFEADLKPGTGEQQFLYEIADQNYEKPIVMRNMPFLSNHLSKEPGVLGVYCRLNEELVPAIQVRYEAPCTPERLWELMTMETWTITYSPEKVKEEAAKISFAAPGTVKPVQP